MEIGLFVTPQQGATYGDQLAAAVYRGGRRIQSSCAPITTSERGEIRLPGPTDTWITLAGLGRETTTIEPRGDGQRGDVPAARPMSIIVRRSTTWPMDG